MAVEYHAAIGDHRNKAPLGRGVFLELDIPKNKIAYNPAFIAQGERSILAVRVESKDSHWLVAESWDPEIWFFELSRGNWVRLTQPTLTLAEDPFVAWIGSQEKRELIFGHVTLDRTAGPLPVVLTRFYRVNNFQELAGAKPFAEVRDMKDIRLCELVDGRILVCGRPKGEIAGRGRVSLAVLDSLDDLSHDAVWGAKVLPHMIAPEMRIGNNELHRLPDGRVGVLGHLAIGVDEQELHYAAATWIIDPTTLQATAPKIVSERRDFPSLTPKFDFLADVVFPGSLVTESDGSCTLYCGISDSSVASIRIPAPFNE